MEDVDEEVDEVDAEVVSVTSVELADDDSWVDVLEVVLTEES